MAINANGTLVRRGKTEDFGPNLSDVAQMWPTPSAQDWKQRGTERTVRDRVARGKQVTLELFMALWRTPTSSDSFGQSARAWQTRTDGDPTPRLSDQVAMKAYPIGLPDPTTTLDGNQSSPAGLTSSRRLNPKFVAWLMGLDPMWCNEISRTDALRCLGNAVVPVQAAAAIRELWTAIQEHQRTREVAA